MLSERQTSVFRHMLKMAESLREIGKVEWIPLNDLCLADF